MPNFMFAYIHHGGKMPERSEEGAKGMEKFMTWLGGLGEAVVNPGTPLGMSKTVSSDGVSEDSGADHLTGFSIIKANSMDAALEIGKACPFLDIGTVDVAEMMEMS